VKTIATLALGIILGLCAQAQSPALGIDEGLELLANDCGLSFAQSTHKRVTAVTRHNGRPPFYQLHMALQLGPTSTATVGHVIFNCRTSGSEGKGPTGAQVSTQVPAQAPQRPPAADSAPVSPKRILQDEDAGGRYFRHVKWERKFVATHWQGVVVYSDYSFGDGQKTITAYYLACQTELRLPCIEFVMTPDAKKDSLQHRRVLDFLAQVSWRAQ
jgi:hypothetical protein